MAVGAILGQKPQIPQPVDTVQQGNMNAVTSNAVYEAIQGNEGVKIYEFNYTPTDSEDSKIITTPFKPYIALCKRTLIGNPDVSDWYLLSRLWISGWGIRNSLDDISGNVYDIIGSNFINWNDNNITILKSNYDYLLNVDYNYEMMILGL